MLYQHGKRGLFIVFEGVNGSGKTSTIREIMKYAVKYEHIKVFKFPDRNGPDGVYIDSFLKETIEIRSVYDRLSLFSNNRLQYVDEIVNALENGITVICDRYIYSAIVYQLPINYRCSDIHLYAMASIVGYFDKEMPKPDIIFLMDANFLESRKDEHKERYHYEYEKQCMLFNYFKRVLSISDCMYFIVQPTTGNPNDTAIIVMDVIDRFYTSLTHMPLQFLYSNESSESILK